MTLEIEQFIERAQYCQRDIRKLATMLPNDDALLDKWIGHSLVEGNAHAFQCLIAAGLHAGRKIDARHLEQGVDFVAGTNALGCMAWKLQGNVAHYLMRAVLTERLQIVVEVNSLYVIAAWCVAFNDSKFPPELVPATRRAIRDKNLPLECSIPLYGVAVMTKDPDLMTMLGELVQMGKKQVHPGRMKELTTSHLPICKGPMIDTVPVALKVIGSDDGPMRRPTAKVGRNDPCPCGSGKKHKHCCIGKESEPVQSAPQRPSLRDRSPDDPEYLMELLKAEPERPPTRFELRKASFPETLRYDVTRLPQELWQEFFLKLAGFGYLDEAMDRLKQLPQNAEAWLACWAQVAIWATRARRKEMLQEVINLLPPEERDEKDLPVDQRLLLAEDDPAKFWSVLDEATLEALKTTDTKELEEFSAALLNSKAQSLGIFVTRSLIPMFDKFEAGRLLDSILQVRDKLSLPAEEPYDDILDQQLTAHSENLAGSAKLDQAQQKLEAKAREVRELKESLHEISRQLELREKKAEAASQDTQPEKADDRAMHDLRRKVENLKTALKDRHFERNELRRELQKAHEDLEKWQSKASEVPAVEQREADEEESLFIPAEAETQQPIRLIEFPRKFDETLNGFPRHVARAAMVTIGRLAAGEPAAFLGMVKLKACPNLLRQRIGSDYRLLFRLTQDRVQIVDLINRKDLFKKLKTLV